MFSSKMTDVCMYYDDFQVLLLYSIFLGLFNVISCKIKIIMYNPENEEHSARVTRTQWIQSSASSSFI